MGLVGSLGWGSNFVLKLKGGQLRCQKDDNLKMGMGHADGAGERGEWAVSQLYLSSNLKEGAWDWQDN